MYICTIINPTYLTTFIKQQTKLQMAITKTPQIPQIKNIKGVDIIPVEIWDPTDIKFSETKINKSGKGKMFFITRKNGNRFCLKIGPVTTPFGISYSDEKNNPIPKPEDDWKMRLSLEENIVGNIKAFDEAIINEAMQPKRAIDWLGQKQQKETLTSREVVESKYQYPMCRYDIDKQTGEIRTGYAPFMLVKIKKIYGTQDIDTEIYDKDGVMMNDIKLDPNAGINYIKQVIPRQTRLTCLLQPNGWVSAGFGVTWKCKQIRVVSVPDFIPRGTCLICDDIDDENIVDNHVADPVPIAVPQQQIVPLNNEDEDEDDKNDVKQKEKVENIIESDESSDDDSSEDSDLDKPSQKQIQKPVPKVTKSRAKKN